MRNRVFAIIAVMLFITAAGAWAEIEFGVGISPPIQEKPKDMPDEAAGPLGDIMLSFHGGFSFLWLFYVSADAFVLPPYVVENMTTYIDTASGYVANGVFLPGFIGMFDVGIRPKIGPIGLLAEVGVNMLYIYKQEELPPGAYVPELGLNARVGAYFFLTDNISITASAATIFSNIDSMEATFKALAGKDEYLQQQAIDGILSNLYPTVGLNIHF